MMIKCILSKIKYIQMSLLLRVRGFYLLNKQEKTHNIAWIAEISTSQMVADRNFIVEKIVKNCYGFYYYHSYLSILALLSSEFIDPLGSLSCR